MITVFYFPTIQLIEVSLEIQKLTRSIVEVEEALRGAVSPVIASNISAFII